MNIKKSDQLFAAIKLKCLALSVGNPHHIKSMVNCPRFLSVLIIVGLVLLSIMESTAGTRYDSAKAVYRTNQDLALNLLKQDLKIGADAPGENHYMIGYILKHFKKDYINALQHYEEAVLYYSKNNNNKKLKEVYLELGSLYSLTNQYASSSMFYEMAYQTKSGFGKLNFYYVKGYNFRKAHIYDSAYFTMLEAYDLAITKKNKIFITKILTELAILSQKVKDYRQSKEWSNELISFLKWHDEENYHGMGIALNNLGNTYRKEQKYDSALHYFQKALIYKNQEKLQLTYYNIASIYEDKGRLDSAVHYFKLSVDNREGRRYNNEYITALEDLMTYDKGNKEIYGDLLIDVAIESKTECVLNIEKASLEMAVFLAGKRQEEAESQRAMSYVGMLIMVLVIVMLLGLMYKMSRRKTSDRFEERVKILSVQNQELQTLIKQFMNLKK